MVPAWAYLLYAKFIFLQQIAFYGDDVHVLIAFISFYFLLLSPVQKIIVEMSNQFNHVYYVSIGLIKVFRHKRKYEPGVVHLGYDMPR